MSEARTGAVYDINSPSNARGHERYDIIGTAMIRTGTFQCSAILLDIGANGAAFSSFGVFRPGDCIELVYNDGSASAAKVCWDNGVRTGCEFDEPISQDRVWSLADRC